MNSQQWTVLDALKDFPGRKLLTLRDLVVLSQVITGADDESIARSLALSVETIALHRSRIMLKLHAQDVAELVKMVRDSP